MPESEENSKAGIRIMTPDEEDARAVARAIASNTAGGILRSFQGQELTASEIAAAINQPIPTIMYHLDALLEAGLIEVSRITYSVKGREVKKYRQSERVFIVAPRQADVRAALLKYAQLFGFTLFFAGITFILLQWYRNNQLYQDFTGISMNEKSAMPAIGNNQAKVVCDNVDIAREMAPVPTPPQALAQSPSPQSLSGSLSDFSPDPSSQINGNVLNTFGLPDLITGILIGGFLIIIVLICLDFISSHRKKHGK